MPTKLFTSHLTTLVEAAQARRATDARHNFLLAQYVQSKDGSGSEELFSLLEERAACTDPLHKFLHEALSQTLADAHHSGSIKPVTPATGATIFHDLWTALIENGWDALPDHDQQALVQTFSNLLVERVALAPSLRPPQEAVQTLTECIMSGNLPAVKGTGDALINFADGQPAYIKMENWEPTLYSNAEGSDLRQPPNDLVFHKTVTFPSGRLLVCDMIRIKDLEGQLGELCKFMKLRLNYAEDRVRRTEAFAAIGIVQVLTQHEAPNLTKDPENDFLICGAKGSALAQVAEIPFDHFGTTIIDRETVAKLLTPEGETTDAVNALIDDWVAQDPRHNEIAVTPGEWHLYWDDDGKTVSSAFAQSGFSIPHKTNFVLSPNSVDISANSLRDLETVSETAA